MPIARRKASSATPADILTDPGDAPHTVGAPTATEDIIPTDFFSGWDFTPRSEMTLDGPGGVAIFERVEVVRASRDVTG